LFPGPGPARTALRDVDWAPTELGDPAGWPCDLACAARTLTNSAAPMLLWWGAQFYQLHNDAVLAALDERLPALGRPAKRCWPERWEIFEPSVSTVLESGTPLHVDELALPTAGNDTSYWALALSPLYDYDDALCGVLATGCDLTARESARHAADATTANLQIALATNRRIGMAIGVLMAHRRITDLDAFELLRVVSQRSHRKLRELAEDVLLTGELPA
jgi:hypothetical protein